MFKPSTIWLTAYRRFDFPGYGQMERGMHLWLWLTTDSPRGSQKNSSTISKQFRLLWKAEGLILVGPSGMDAHLHFWLLGVPSFPHVTAEMRLLKSLRVSSRHLYNLSVKLVKARLEISNYGPINRPHEIKLDESRVYSHTFCSKLWNKQNCLLPTTTGNIFLFLILELHLTLWTWRWPGS